MRWRCRVEILWPKEIRRSFWTFSLRYFFGCFFIRHRQQRYRCAISWVHLIEFYCYRRIDSYILHKNAMAFLLCSVDKSIPTFCWPIRARAFFVAFFERIKWIYRYIRVWSSDCKHCTITAINVLCDKTPEMVFSQVDDERLPAGPKHIHSGLWCGMANGGGNTPLTVVLSTYFHFDIRWSQARTYHKAMLMYRWSNCRFNFRCRSWARFFCFFFNFFFFLSVAHSLGAHLFSCMTWHIYTSNWFDWTEFDP